ITGHSSLGKFVNVTTPGCLRKRQHMILDVALRSPVAHLLNGTHQSVCWLAHTRFIVGSRAVLITCNSSSDCAFLRNKLSSPLLFLPLPRHACIGCRIIKPKAFRRDRACPCPKAGGRYVV